MLAWIVGCSSSPAVPVTSASDSACAAGGARTTVFARLDVSYPEPGWVEIEVSAGAADARRGCKALLSYEAELVSPDGWGTQVEIGAECAAQREETRPDARSSWSRVEEYRLDASQVRIAESASGLCIGAAPHDATAVVRKVSFFADEKSCLDGGTHGPSLSEAEAVRRWSEEAVRLHRERAGLSCTAEGPHECDRQSLMLKRVLRRRDGFPPDGNGPPAVTRRCTRT